jgi:hypothetical protein
MSAKRARWDRLGFVGTAAEQRAADVFLADLRGARALPAGSAGRGLGIVADLATEPVEALATHGSEDSSSLQEADEGESAVHFPQLLAHASPGTSYDLRRANCILRWANVARGQAGPVDVVVHFHGFKSHNAMRLQQKADASGVDLDVAGLTRPTVGIVPHGHAFPARHRCADGSRLPCPRQTWRVQCPGGSREAVCQDGFDFPALEGRTELLGFVRDALAEVARERGSAELTCGRLMVTGHSGGGSHLSKLFHTFSTSDEISAFHFFDATYGGLEPIIARDGWLVRSLRRDAGALAGVGQADWPHYMQRTGHHLRLAFISGTGTASVATSVDRFIQERVEELTSNQALRELLRKYYRAQSTTGLAHDAIPRSLGGGLLVDAGRDFRGVLQDLPAPPSLRAPSRRRPSSRPAELFDEEEEDAAELIRIVDEELVEHAPELVEHAPALVESAPVSGAWGRAQETDAVDSGLLSQASVDRLASVTLSSASDLHSFFVRAGTPHFTAWYNSELAGKGPFTRRGSAIRMPSGAEARGRFDRFWDQIPSAYGRSHVTLLEFAALMCLVLNETGGRFAGYPERCGGGRSDALGRHPGLAYAFDRIIDVKRSYNTAASNRRAGVLFDDAEFIRAHGSLAGGAELAGQGSERDGVWHGQLFPQQAYRTDEDPVLTGFIMQADFYKFRGRGVIQTTGRESYLKVVRYIQGYRGASPLICQYRDRWQGLGEDQAATVSTTQDWDQLFDDPEVLATGPALHGRQGSRDYRIMDRRAGVLNHVPASTGDTVGTAGSIYALGRRVSGRYRYGAGIYRERVLALLSSALPLV